MSGNDFKGVVWANEILYYPNTIPEKFMLRGDKNVEDKYIFLFSKWPFKIKVLLQIVIFLFYAKQNEAVIVVIFVVPYRYFSFPPH